MKENTGIVVTELPIEVTAYLLNEKRDSIEKITQRHGPHVRLLPTPGLETPHYRVHRYREGDPEASRHFDYQSSMAHKPVETEKSRTTKPASSQRRRRERPVIDVAEHITDSPNGKGLAHGLRRFFNLFSSPSAPLPVETKTEPSSSERSRQSESDRRRRRSRRRRGTGQQAQREQRAGGDNSGQGSGQPRRRRRGRRGGRNRRRATTAESANTGSNGGTPPQGAPKSDAKSSTTPKVSSPSSRGDTPCRRLIYSFEPDSASEISSMIGSDQGPVTL